MSGSSSVTSTGKKRVACVVFNSVSHDTRVLKVADSLRQVGHDVRIIGLQDANCWDAASFRDNGVSIVRLDWQSTFQRWQAIAITTVLALSLALYVAAFDPLWEGWRMRHTISTGLALILLGVIGIRWQLNLARGLHAVALDLIGCLALGMLLAANLGPMEPFAVETVRFGVKLAGILIFVYLTARTWARFWRVTAAYRKRASGIVTPKELGLWHQLGTIVAETSKQRIALRAVREYEPDIVHCHDLPTVSVGIHYASRSPAKVIYDSHEIYEEQSLVKRATLLHWRYVISQARIGKRINAFVTINDSIAAYLRERYPDLPEATIVKNATVFAGAFPHYDGRLHKEAGLSRETNIVLYQGGFAPFRGLETLVQAAPLLDDPWCLVMMGWGSHEPVLRRLGEKVDPHGTRVRFVRRVPQEELLQWTAGGRIGVIPYENCSLNHWYCTPNKLWEFPAAGVPVLVSAFPELRAPVETYKIGWLLPEHAGPQEVAEAINGLRDAEIDDARRACESYMLDESWTKYSARLLRLYSKLECQ